jgi:hypothetical protein
MNPGLTDANVKFLQKKKFDLNQYIGQGYDNAASVTGKTVVYKTTLHQNLLVFNVTRTSQTESRAE